MEDNSNTHATVRSWQPALVWIGIYSCLNTCPEAPKTDAQDQTGV